MLISIRQLVSQFENSVCDFGIDIDIVIGGGSVSDLKFLV